MIIMTIIGVLGLCILAEIASELRKIHRTLKEK